MVLLPTARVGETPVLAMSAAETTESVTLAERYRRACETRSDIHEHLPLLAELAARADVVVELGVRTGVSTVAWLYGLPEHGRLFSVDVAPRPDLPDDPRWTFIRGDDTDSDTIAQLPARADVVFIDTSHDYHHTARELDLYRSMVKPGGVIVCHDTELEHPIGVVGPPYPVRRAIGEFCARTGWRWEKRRNCFGLGIIHAPGAPAARRGCYGDGMNPELRARRWLPAAGLLEPALARVVWKTLLLAQWRGECFRDNHVPTAAAITNAALTDALLLELRPRIEAIAGCRLVPTYSYARLYFHGDAFIRHSDRASCEVSVSINVGRDGGTASLWFPPDTEVAMAEGDGVVYLGCETDHWRERFVGRAMGQLLLHYVVADGPHAAESFDRNPDRFPPSIVAAAEADEG